MKKKYKRDSKDWRRKRHAGFVDLKLIEETVREAGLTLKVSRVTSGKTTYQHWMFYLNDKDNTKIDYYPTTGNWKYNFEKGTARNPRHMAMIATTRKLYE